MSLPDTPIQVCQTAAAGRDQALVLRSQGIDSEVLVTPEQVLLLVPRDRAAAARAELAAWEKENSGWPPRSQPLRYDYLGAWPGIIAYVLLVLVMAWAAVNSAGFVDWLGAGKVDARLIRNGEWWRAVTALTLHLDVAHLAGNLASGAVFGYIAGRFFGSGIAWLAILLSGTAGNLLNSYLMSPTHTSVGASTAIFAALGMSAAFAWRRKLYPQDRWALRLGPIIAGVALLAYTGTGGERTDVSAHITGFLCGGGAGLLLALWPKPIPRGVFVQSAAGVAAVVLLGIAWNLALR